MRYKNTETGAIVDSASIVKGKNWELVGKNKPEDDQDTDLKKKTKDQLFKMLEEKEIAYKPEQTKDELIALLEE